MTDETTPEPAVTAPTEPATASAPPAAPAATTTRSPWPVLIPVIVGVSALLLGGVIGGVTGFGLGSRLDRGPSIEFRMPDGGMPGNNGSQGGPFGDRDQRGDGGFGTQGSAAHGTVSSIDADSITVELSNGDTITYRLTDDTDVVEVTESSTDALAEGDEVTVVGTGRGDDREARLIRTGDGLLPLGGPSTEG